MILKEIIAALEILAPPSLQEEYDNAGLLTGNPTHDCTGALICLDVTEEIIREAIAKKCNLVIAHHPIIFKGLKKLNGKNYIERTVIAAIKNDIAVYAIHTNLDNVIAGVNGKIAEKLGLKNISILLPKKDLLKKLVVFCPEENAAALIDALFAAGAGNIGNYSECSFISEGIGSFNPGHNSDPHKGEKFVRDISPEKKIEVIFPAWLERRIIDAMKITHPYEEVAHDIYSLSNGYQEAGSGIIGYLSEEASEINFLKELARSFGAKAVKHTRLTGKPIKKVAVCGGAGSFLIPDAKAAGADAYVTSDLKYHEFFDAEDRMLLADIGHFESEQYTIDLIFDLLRDKFPNFALLKTGVSTNPVHYFIP